MNKVKETYRFLFNFIKQNDKIYIITFLIYLFLFIVGYFEPNIMYSYQESLILKTIDAKQLESMSFLSIFLIVLKNNFLTSLIVIVFSFILIVPILFLILNGYVLGAVTNRYSANDSLPLILSKILPHGMFEIFAMVLLFGTANLIGFSMFYRNKKERLIQMYKVGIKMFVYLVAPLLIIAGIIESLLIYYKDSVYGFIGNLFSNLVFLNIFYTLILLYLFYIVIKTLIQYYESRNVIMLGIAFIVLYLSWDIWTKTYGLRVEEFFRQFNILLKLIPLGIFLLYTYFENQKYQDSEEKKKISNAFAQYLNPDVVSEILKDPSKLELGGGEEEITIFFSDIRGFTSLSEKLSPQELVSLLNEYLSSMTNIILDNRGLVDKYIGDAIVAFWGAPVKEEKHPYLACLAAMEMKKELDKLNKKWVKEGKEPLNIGIGLNTGRAVVGNMGSEKRFDYTMMGDEVNLGSRLEGITKEYKVTIIVSETTRRAIKGFFYTRELDFVRVKGKLEPVRIYELVSEEKKLSKEQKVFCEKFSRALKLYREQKWNDAIKSFTELASKYKDKTSEVFIERIKLFKLSPPPKNWDGVYTMTTK